MDAQTTPLSAVVADDEPEIRDLISEYLIKLGYQVTRAGDGLEALLHVRDRRPTLLIPERRHHRPDRNHGRRASRSRDRPGRGRPAAEAAGSRPSRNRST